MAYNTHNSPGSFSVTDKFKYFEKLSAYLIIIDYGLIIRADGTLKMINVVVICPGEELIIFLLGAILSLSQSEIASLAFLVNMEIYPLLKEMISKYTLKLI